MKSKPLVALVASLLALPAAAVNVPLPPETFEDFAPLPPVPPMAPLPPIPPMHLAAADAPRARTPSGVPSPEDLSRDLEAEMGALFAHRVSSHRVVKGQPYSAEVITENKQALTDGNVISRKTSGRVYRDADGRTRDETEGREGKARSVVIFDPVAGKNTVLLPDSKRAIVSATHGTETRTKQVVNIDGTEVRVEDGRVTVNGKEVADGKVNLKSRNGVQVRVENGQLTVDSEEAKRDGARMVFKGSKIDGMPVEVTNVEVIRLGDNPGPEIAPPAPPPPPPPPPGGFGVAPPPPPPLPPLPGISTFRYESTSRLGKGVAAKLGTKEFDGVRAEGNSTTWTIPAGQIGNRDPIKVVSEQWYSPDLQVTVYSRYNDPRTGESIYRLASIKRAAPPADLFQVPAGYELTDRSKMAEEIRARAREARDRARDERQRALEERRRQLDEQRRQLDEQQRELDQQRKGG